MKKAVLFLTFNRYENTQKVFEQIILAQPPRLYISSDGARPEIEGEREEVVRIRKFLLDNINWNCEIKTKFNEENMGCGNCVASAITWFFENEKDGIILEDDVVPHQSFFQFCSELLDYYKEDKRVWHISGFNPCVEMTSKDSYFFSSQIFEWGWATWRDRWIPYFSSYIDDDYPVEALSFISQDKRIQSFYKEILGQVQSKITDDIWDYQWKLILLKNKALSIIPTKNLISNIGVTGVHYKNKIDDPCLNLETFDIFQSHAMIHPKLIKIDSQMSDAVCKKKLWEFYIADEIMNIKQSKQSYKWIPISFLRRALQGRKRNSSANEQIKAIDSSNKNPFDTLIRQACAWMPIRSIRHAMRGIIKIFISKNENIISNQTQILIQQDKLINELNEFKLIFENKMDSATDNSNYVAGKINNVAETTSKLIGKIDYATGKIEYAHLESIDKIKQISHRISTIYRHTSYSQQGEDLLLYFQLQYYVKYKEKGCYIDIGANHPFELSNTQLFYEHGWRGINIDATPGFKKLFDLHRPEDINLEIGVSDKEEILDFYSMSPNVYSSFNKEDADYWISQGHTLDKVIPVQTETINNILEKYLKPNQSIDFISLDVEGLELAILNDFNFEKYSPTYFIVEENDLKHKCLTTYTEYPIYKLLSEQGYIVFAKTICNVIFQKISKV